MYLLLVIHTCSKEEADTYERKYICELDTIFPNGYNLKIGGQMFNHSHESKKRLSNGVVNYFKNKKMERFKDVILPRDFDVNNHIHPLNRNGKQMGWYVLFNYNGKKMKVDFGGIHIDINISRQMADDFFNQLTRE